jgi:alpha-beta hydrolase superfamily lysophospholipase
VSTDGTRTTERRLAVRTHDNLDLSVHVWSPPQPRAAVLIIHGVCEHGGRYKNLVSPLTTSDYEVWAMDHRGHGKSPGRRGHINAWSDYRKDLDALLDTFVANTSDGTAQSDNKPFLFAHSMGALIAVEWLIAQANNADRISGAIVEGLPIQPGEVATAAKIRAAKVMSRIIPTFTLPFSKDRSGLSTDPSVAVAFDADPLTHNKVTARWGVEILQAIERVKQSPQRLTAPVLLVHGGDDPLNLASGVESWFPSVGANDKSLVVFPGNRHEVHNDQAKATLASVIVEWLNVRVAASGSQGSQDSQDSQDSQLS